MTMAARAACTSVSVLDAVQALAFVGDLSMGQPIDHSARTAWLARQLAALPEGGGVQQDEVACTALLRWSGCTANAPEFSELMGDDVSGRRAMLANVSTSGAAAFAAKVGPLAAIHCEVSGDIARLLGMPPRVEQALRQIFDRYDGWGQPGRPSGAQVPQEVFITNIAGDLEIFSRVHGLSDAVRIIAARAGSRYPAALADAVGRHAADWLHALDQGAAAQPPLAGDAANTANTALGASVPLELVADVIDLKLPWMTGYSRRVADAAVACATRLGLGTAQQDSLYRAALIHGIGRASVPNAVWEAPVLRSEADRERLRLVPYWTDRAARRLTTLRTEAQIASYVDERLDGSGYFRGASGPAIDTSARVLATAAHWTWLRTARPGQPALSDEEAAAALQREGELGRLDGTVIAALLGHSHGALLSNAPAVEPAAALSSREVEVLRHISLGASNKEAARTLGISPSTVRAHLENVFRKLGCSTRAAATLKAMTQGLL